MSTPAAASGGQLVGSSADARGGRAVGIALLVVLAGAGMGALLLPWATPASLAGLVAGLGAVALAFAVYRPGSFGPLLVIAAATLSWLSAVPSPGLVRSLVFAFAVFTVHSAAALAAAIPLGAGIDLRLLVRQGLRMVAVFGAGCLLVAPTVLLDGRPGSTWVTMAGIAAVGLLLLVQTRRR